MPRIKALEDIEVYNRTYALALKVHKISLNFPDYEKFSVASQIRRCSKGMCANIVEGFAKHHKSAAEFKRFLLIAVGSSEERRLWLRFCEDLDYTLNSQTKCNTVERCCNGKDIQTDHR